MILIRNESILDNQFFEIGIGIEIYMPNVHTDTNTSRDE